jgi:hypothetical protein
MTGTISLSTAFSHAWKLFKANKKFLILATLASGVVMLITQLLSMQLEDSIIGSILITIISIIVGIIIALGWAQVAIRIVRGNSHQWNDIMTPRNIWWKFFLVQILYNIPIFIVGIIGAIIAVLALSAKIPGSIIILILAIIAILAVAVYVSVRFMFLAFASLQHAELSTIALFKKTARITKGHFLDLIGFYIVSFFINVVGFIMIGVGLLVTIPLTMLAKAYIFEKITHNSDNI